MKKLVLATVVLLTGVGAYALTLESVPSFFGPLSLSPFLQSWKGSLETNAATADASIAVNASNTVTVSQRVTNITAKFDTNTVVTATRHTPTSVGQLLVGATNLYVSIGLTSNSWLRIK